eukprot:508476-Prymnesium_polylepis.1
MFLPVTESLRRLGHMDTRAFTSLYLPNHHSISFYRWGPPALGWVYRPASRTLPGWRECYAGFCAGRPAGA